MLDVIKDWQGNDILLRPGTFWHLSPPNGLLKNNARVGNGVVYSIGAVAELPGLENAVSPYSFARSGDPKEAVWEGVRKLSFGFLPSRLKSFYCFESKELLDRAAREWFGIKAGARDPLAVRIAASALVHRCDAKLLETAQDQWQTSAMRYWKGEMTSAPFPETIVHGAVYLPDWEQFPLGL
jgi:hypothetical protein